MSLPSKVIAPQKATSATINNPAPKVALSVLLK